MDFMVPIKIPVPDTQIHYGQKIMSIGSCFTEHIGNALRDLRFQVMQNPNGILFDPLAVAKAVRSYVDNAPLNEKSVWQDKEIWHSWEHHSRFSATSKAEMLGKIERERSLAHQFIKEADWLIITLGSAFSYQLVQHNNQPVANCHRAPAAYFRKHLLTIEEIHSAQDNMMHQLFHFNPYIKIIFTISPVRHIRDGVIENNRSKARLIEAVHHLVNKFDRLYYFPSYELVIDVLRDYRFYDVDLVHPNFAATRFVLDHFYNTFMNEETRKHLGEVQALVTASRHVISFPGTDAHRQFLESQAKKLRELSARLPSVDFGDLQKYFAT